MRVRRRSICYFQLEDRLLPDFAQFLRGEIVLTTQTSLELLCPLTGERLRVDARDIELMTQVPSDEWREADAELAALAERGVLVAEGSALDAAENRVRETGWHGLAALYHAFSQWRGVSGHDAFNEHSPEAERMRLGVHVERHGPPPAHFFSRTDAIARTPLPLPELDGALYETLRARRTVRSFRCDLALPLAQLNEVLYAVFGAQGVKRLTPGITAVKKTSPSGGGLHPTEAYVLAVQVEGLASGIYHYEPGTHALALLCAVEPAELREIATRCVAGQAYFAEAHALVIHVARFNRNFWKYVEHLKAYKAVLMDCAHLSQTLYLVAASLGLGAFFTGAINDADIGDLLSLDRYAESAIAVSGVGIPDPTRTEIEFHPEPYRPAA